MPLARFLDKVALSASQVLHDFNRAAFEQKLLTFPVRLAIGNDASGSFEGRACLDLAVRLLARLYPGMIVEGGDEEVVEGLQQTARSIHPEIELPHMGQAAATLVVGQLSVPVEGPTVYIGSNGWTASISVNTPCEVGATANPFGAGASACLGAAAVFRVVFSDWLPNLNPITDRTVSVLRPWAANPDADRVDLPAGDIGETHLVGLGAIGNAAVWTLARAQGLTGRLHLIDGERVELSNLQRYVLTTDDDAVDETPKSALAVRAFSDRTLQETALEAVPHNSHWAEYLAGCGDWTLPRVAVGVDSPGDRVAVQASLPRVVLNAWTQSGDLGVSRHSDFLNAACLACLYIPEGKRSSQSHRVAVEIGLPGQEPRVRDYLQRRKPVDLDLLRDVAAALKTDLDELRRYEGQLLDAFYAEFVCGGHRFRIVGEEGSSREVDAPLAFQSALAGVLLAAEIVADAGSLRSSPPPALTRTDVLSAPGIFVSDSEPKGLGGRCLCQDDDFRQRYKSKYHY